VRAFGARPLLKLTQLRHSPERREDCILDLYAHPTSGTVRRSHGLTDRSGSIHAEEDEHVVRHVLASDEARDGRFVLAPRSDVLPTWPRRGRASEMEGDDGKRCSARQRKNSTLKVAFSTGRFPAAVLPGRGCDERVLRRVLR
jgi:hypothetical protein